MSAPMDEKGVELPMFDWARMAIIAADELCAPDEHGVTEKCSACLAILGTRWTLSMRETLQQAEQQGEALLEKACWANAQRIIAEANLDHATKALAEAKSLDTERVKHSHALSETVNELRLLLDHAQKELAAEAWIEIKEGCEMPKHNEHVLVKHMAGYWTKWHFLRKFQGDFAKDCTHYRRITPPAGAGTKEKL